MTRHLDDAARDLQAIIEKFDKVETTQNAAWGSVWLHGNWYWLTKNMSTEQREVAADCVERWNATLNAHDPSVGEMAQDHLRWWRDTFTCPKCGKISHHPLDIKHQYCGGCHKYIGEQA